MGQDVHSSMALLQQINSMQFRDQCKKFLMTTKYEQRLGKLPRKMGNQDSKIPQNAPKGRKNSHKVPNSDLKFA